MSYEFVHIIDDADWALVGIVPNNNQSGSTTQKKNTVPEKPSQIISHFPPKVHEEPLITQATSASIINEVNTSLASMYATETDPIPSLQPSQMMITSRSNIHEHVLIGFGK